MRKRLFSFYLSPPLPAAEPNTPVPRSDLRSIQLAFHVLEVVIGPRRRDGPTGVILQDPRYA
jgi:hypothetical protein